MQKEKTTKMIFDVGDKPPFWQNMLFALQQFLSVIVATILVPVIADKTGIYLNQSSALVGAGVGTIVYLLFTKFKSPAFLGSSFAFITPLTIAVGYGHFGILLGSVFAGATYCLLAVIIKLVGSNWIDKIMPPIIIGPIVALIGFDLSTSAIQNLTTSINSNYNLVSIFVGIMTFFVVVFVSVKGGKRLQMFPFVFGILFGYALSLILSLFGTWLSVPSLVLVDFSGLGKIADFSNWVPRFTFVGLFDEGLAKINGFGDVLSIFVAFVPIAMVSFAEHIADHKNIGQIVGKDLFKNPGLHRTLLGDGVGSTVGALFGGCPNTTYGESIGCVALSKNASTSTILISSIMCIVVAFFYPVVAIVQTIPTCVVGGVCIGLYGFISVSGLRMIQGLDLTQTKNLFVVASIFICGIGRLELNFGSVVLPNIACALIVGVITNAIVKPWKAKNAN